jgi:hypothetical protein
VILIGWLVLFQDCFSVFFSYPFAKQVPRQSGGDRRDKFFLIIPPHAGSPVLVIWNNFFIRA